MRVNQYTDEQLAHKIKRRLTECEITSIGNVEAKDIPGAFLAYTPLGRQVILDYYEQLEKSNNMMNFVERSWFRRCYFYVSSEVVIAALLLLDFTVNEKRQANVTNRSTTRVLKQNVECLRPEGPDYFERNQLRSRDIHTTWEEWY